MSTDSLKVAIIGGGMIANAAHIPAWKDAAGVQLLGVADLLAGNAEATARRHGIPHAYTDVERMLADLQPDIVSVCSPAGYHMEHTVAALRAGAHVMCEKPVAPCHAEAARMFDEAAAAGRHLFVAQSMRFYNQIEVAHDLAAAGELGEMYCAQASRLRRRGVPRHGVFHMKAHSGGGVLFDLGTHVLDTVLWIMGNPTVVAATGMTYRKLTRCADDVLTSRAEQGAFAGVFEPRPYDPKEFDVEEMATAFLRLENGGTISMQVSWAANVPDSAGGVWITGTEGGLSFDPRSTDLTLIKNMRQYQVDITPKVPPPEPKHPFYAHWKEVAHFLRVIRGEESLIVRREEVLNVMLALESIYRSAAEGREIPLHAEALA